jgi:hypothetical protein
VGPGVLVSITASTCLIFDELGQALIYARIRDPAHVAGVTLGAGIGSLVVGGAARPETPSP